MAEVPLWSQAWDRLQRIRKGQDIPSSYQQKPAATPAPNLEDRLLEEDRKKKRDSQKGMNVDTIQQRADKTAYGMGN